MPSLLRLYAAASDEDREVFLSNWDGSKMQALKHYIAGYTMHEAAVLLYHDLFRYDAQRFVEAMRRLCDAVLVEKENRLHLVVYTPSILRPGLVAD